MITEAAHHQGSHAVPGVVVHVGHQAGRIATVPERVLMCIDDHDSVLCSLSGKLRGRRDRGQWSGPVRLLQFAQRGHNVVRLTIGQPLVDRYVKVAGFRGIDVR